MGKSDGLHPEPAYALVSARQAIGRDGWIDYKRNYRKGGIMEWARWEFDRPAPTLTRTDRSWRIYVGGVRRMFTKQEMLVLCGFPARFKMSVTDNRSMKLLGNVVPPPMMMAIAESIRRALREREGR